jgi:hypothetical protein
MLSHPEWSIASALLFGHAITKLICGVIKVGGGNGEAIGLVVTAGIVLGLTPSLTVLVMMQLTERAASGPPGWLIVTQSTLFLFAVSYFVIFRWIGELLERAEPLHREPEPN